MNSPDSGRSPVTPPITAAWTWNQMLDRFRALGGAADNIVQREGPLGRGIFPRDPEKPILLRVPPNLLVPVEDIEFGDGRIKVRESSQIEKRERYFFEKYQNEFSWGNGGRAEIEACIDGLDRLPSSLRELLGAEFDFNDFLHDTGSDRIFRRFIQTRYIKWNGRMVAMPLMELVNHGPEADTYGTGDDRVSVKGMFSSEVLVRYCRDDPFGIFTSWGFASPEFQAFSFPLTLKLEGCQIAINRDITVAGNRKDFRFPVVTSAAGNLALSFLMIGNAKAPKISKGIFYRLMKDNGLADAEATFDRILHFNRTKFLTLLGALEALQGEMITTLRTAIRYQLDAMSHCIGTRDL